MSDDRSLIPRPAGALAHPGQTPMHGRVAPSWTDAPLTREECLQLLPVRVRDTVFERVGASIEWWATDLSDGGVSLVAFGSKALVTVNPVPGRDGRPAFQLATIHLNEATRRKAHIQEVASPSTAAPAARPGAGQSGLAQRVAPMRRFLGLLPPRAQQLMQEPFAGGADELGTDYLIFRHGPADAPGGCAVSLWGYITDRRMLTVCSGAGYGYRDGTGVAGWDLNCWRVETTARRAVTA